VGRLKVAIRTVGCRANQADSGALARRLDPHRVEVVSGFDGAHIAVINTCCVTAEAERDCRKAARRALKEAPGARVALVGCAVTAVNGFGEDIDPRIECRGGGDAEPAAVAAWINGLAGSSVEAGNGAPLFGGRTRALLKVQTGCSHGCSYCIVPRARGPERSLFLDAALEETTRLVEEGYREIVLTGVQLGAWGKDLQERPGLGDLVTAVAAAARPGRVRLSSVEPWSVTDGLIDAMASTPNVCPHLHVPLQSGDDGVLRAMKRGYSAAAFLETAARVRSRLPDVALGTDVITGFPGEDAPAFARSLEVLEELRPAYVHAFSYSPRSGTRAERLPDRPPKELARRRTREVREFADATAARFRASQIGAVRQIIVEEVGATGARGLTDNYLRVELGDSGLVAGALLMARLEPASSGEERLRAVPVEG
jgi:threonylcarbamoyladenosine tRNA methylthiotransferase MtaB